MKKTVSTLKFLINSRVERQKLNKKKIKCKYFTSFYFITFCCCCYYKPGLQSWKYNERNQRDEGGGYVIDLLCWINE